MHPFNSPRWLRFLQVSRMVLMVSMMLAIFQLPAHAEGKELPVNHPVFYRTIQVDGLSIFYREAGPKDAPTLLPLHGLPSSSRMFEPMFSRLSDRYHLVAPDYPGFGHSDWPDSKKFAYTFDHLAETMNHFTEALGLSRYTLYMQDYGGPVGFRMALAHSGRIEGLTVQDAVAHNEGLGAIWKTRRAFGPTVPPTKARFVQTCCRCRRRARAMSEAIPTWNAITPICGRMNLLFSIGPTRPRFRVTSSTITAPTSKTILGGKLGCVKSSRACW